MIAELARNRARTGVELDDTRAGFAPGKVQATTSILEQVKRDHDQAERPGPG